MVNVTMAACKLARSQFAMIHYCNGIALRETLNYLVWISTHYITEVGSQVHSSGHYGVIEIRFIIKTIFTNLVSDISKSVRIAIVALSADPAAHVPRKCLVYSNRTISKPTNVRACTHVNARSIMMVNVLVLAQSSIIRLNIPSEIWIVRSC